MFRLVDNRLGSGRLVLRVPLQQGKDVYLMRGGLLLQ
jgi:hypothetical protein